MPDEKPTPNRLAKRRHREELKALVRGFRAAQPAEHVRLGQDRAEARRRRSRKAARAARRINR